MTVFPVLAGRILDHVLVLEQIVGHGDQRRKTHIDLGLTARSHFMMLGFNEHPDLLQGQHHIASEILHAVGGGYRKITFLVTHFVGQVGILFPAGIPSALDGVKMVIPLVFVLIETDVVKDEKFGLGPEKGPCRPSPGTLHNSPPCGRCYGGHGCNPRRSRDHRYYS